MVDPETSSGNGGSSESLNTFKYQVFLSFRGPDVRKGFIDHLYRRLIAEGLTVFLDNIELPFGEEIALNLDEAIEKSCVSVIILSPTYADSRWCLEEVVKIMECKASSLDHNVLPVFYNVEPTDVRHQSGPYANAFANKWFQFTIDMSRVKYRTALRKLGKLRGLSLKDVDGYEGKLVDDVTKEVKNRVRSRELFVKEIIIGRDSIVQEVSTWLQGVSNVAEVGMIYGAGGMGKSTVSAIVYNKNLSNFTASCFVADFERDLTCVLEQIVSDISKKPLVKIHNVQSGLTQLKNEVGCRKTLLILDNVDDLTKVEAMFKNPGVFHPESKIIITTRNQEMRKVCKPKKEFGITKLNNTESDKLFNLNAFHSDEAPQEYMTLSKKIIEYCDGLPLALCTLGSSLSGHTPKYWEFILKELASGPVDTVQSILKLSFDSIKDKVTKELFLDIAHYFVGELKDDAFPFLDGLTLSLFPSLADRCLVTVDGNGKLVMHQLIQEMAREIVRQEAPDKPGHRSRLWKYEESLEILNEEKGTAKVKCIRICHKPPGPGGVLISTEGFKGMENLKLLQLESVQLTGCYSNMPKKIKCLEWELCSLKSIPAEFKLDELIVLRMKGNNLVRVFESTADIMVFNALKVIELSNSFELVETPNFSGCPALERVILLCCYKLVKIHESITQLTKLNYLSVTCCRVLRRIPPCSTSVYVDAINCKKLLEIGDHIKIENKGLLFSDRTKYMGYDGLESMNDGVLEEYIRWIYQAVFQSGIFSVFLVGDHIAKWFATTGGQPLSYTVPFSSTRHIRAFNIGCLLDFHSNENDPQLEVQVQDRKWLFLPILFPTRTDIGVRQTWLTHWPITQHRKLNAGDTLKVTFRNKIGSPDQIKCGIKVLYDDESEEKGTGHVQSLNYLKKDNNGASMRDTKIWYDGIFRNSDLYKHEVERENGVYEFLDSRINMVHYDPMNHGCVIC